MADNINNNLLDWDDVIENDGQEFVVLPEGDYTFTVTSFERGHFPGSPKLPACNKATIGVNIDNDQGVAAAKFDLLLCRNLEWKIASFFRCIGQKKHGEKIVMNWNKVVGSRGKAHIKPRDYKDKDGNDRQANEVVRFIDFEPETAYTPVKPDGLPWENSGF